MIVNQEQLRLLKKNQLFNGISDARLALYIKPKNFNKVKDGEILYSPGDLTTKLYLMVEGEVKIKFNKEKTIEFKILFDFFGETEILDRTERFSSAVANKNCVLYLMSLDELVNLCNTDANINANLNKNERPDRKKSILDDNDDGESKMELDDSQVHNEMIDFDAEKDNENYQQLTDEELMVILDKQRAKNIRDGEIKNNQFFDDENSDDLSSGISGEYE